MCSLVSGGIDTVVHNVCLCLRCGLEDRHRKKVIVAKLSPVSQSAGCNRSDCEVISYLGL